LIRNYAGRRGMERCLRVTAGLPEENNAFLVALEAVLDPKERT
jgi:histidinol-phosphate/aromatic aminotransferase/cobyric acid decarboxylase-like protein